MIVHFIPLFQPVVRIYDIPDNTFESDEDEDSDESDEDESDDDDDDGKMAFSLTPYREIQLFTPCEKFLSHPRYLTTVAHCVQVFFFNIGCIGRHVISSSSAHVTMTSKRFNSKWRMPRLWHFSR